MESMMFSDEHTRSVDAEFGASMPAKIRSNVPLDAIERLATPPDRMGMDHPYPTRRKQALSWLGCQSDH